MTDLDLFAGPGGWDEGIRGLGIRPLGIELDPAACATATAAGHRRLRADVTRLDPAAFGPVRGLVASPPCQGFSPAGKGRGRKDTDMLLATLQPLTGAWGQLEDAVASLHATMSDDRSLLALEPLRWCLELQPQWAAWEQVTPVLPLWEACATVLRRCGYSAATGVLSAEQYGVPQTRRRAILVARSPQLTDQLGPAQLPAPTHSRYHQRTPERLDPGVAPWVSQAQALGWGLTGRPYPTLAPGTAAGGIDPQMIGGSGARRLLERERAGGRWVLRCANATLPNNRTKLRPVDHPAVTMAFGHNAAHVGWLQEDAADRAVARMTVVEAGILQTFPADYPWQGKAGAQYRQVGDAVPPLLARAVAAAVAGCALDEEQVA